MTCHSAIGTIDHLGEIISEYGKGSPLEQIKLHRTKCIGLIKNVIAPAIKTELIEDLKNKKFALIIDESTDVSCQKYLCILVRFYSEKASKILTAFLALVEVDEATGENIFNLIKEEMEKNEINLKNCTGFASDGASNMVGCNNSVWSRLKTLSPECVQLRCICHSLALCIQHAMGKLPSNLGFLLSEIPSWFKQSSSRRKEFQALFDVMNTKTEFEEGRTAPLPFEKVSPTRWLVRGKVMYNILQNWEELNTYFVAAEFGSQKLETKYKARLIKEMLSDKSNFLYFHFATPVVQEFEKLNSLFQKNQADPQELHDELHLHFNSLKSRLYDQKNNKKAISLIDFGAKFLSECNNFKKKGSHQEVQLIKERCASMLEDALEQVEKRLPPVKNIYKDLIKLSPSIALNQATRPPFSELPFLNLTDDISLLEEQYRKLPFVDWKEELKVIPKESEEFWRGVQGKTQFKELATYALNCLITPVSNASVERVFSLLSNVKTKARNRLQTTLLETIIRIRAQFMFTNLCCKDFTPSQEMLKNFTPQNVYAASTSNCEEFEDELLQL